MTELLATGHRTTGPRRTTDLCGSASATRRRLARTPVGRAPAAATGEVVSFARSYRPGPHTPDMAGRFCTSVVLAMLTPTGWQVADDVEEAARALVHRTITGPVPPGLVDVRIDLFAAGDCLEISVTTDDGLTRHAIVRSRRSLQLSANRALTDSTC